MARPSRQCRLQAGVFRGSGPLGRPGATRRAPAGNRWRCRLGTLTRRLLVELNNAEVGVRSSAASTGPSFRGRGAAEAPPSRRLCHAYCSHGAVVAPSVDEGKSEPGCRRGDDADALADCSRERPLARRRLAPRRRGVALGASRPAAGPAAGPRCWSATVATCASPTLVMGSAPKGARQPEAAGNAAVDKVGDRRDAVVRESQHEHSDGVRDRCL